MGLTPPPVPTPTPHNGGDFTPQHAKQGAPPPLTKLAWEGPQMQSSSPPLPITPSIPGKGVSSPQVWGGAWKRGGGGAPLCCLLCHCSPPTPCLPPPPRVCPPGAPRGGEVGAGGGGGCCAHWETFRNWENSAGVVPPPPLPVCPLQPGVGGGEKGCVPSWFQWGGGHCRPVEHLIPMVWVGAVSPPTPTPTGTDTQTAWGASTSWGDNFFWGGDDRGWRHRPWLHPATPGGGPAELGVTPTSIGGGLH